MAKGGILSAGRPSVARKKISTISSFKKEVVTKKVNFHLSEVLHTKLKTYAAIHGMTITEILVEYIERLTKE